MLSLFWLKLAYYIIKYLLKQLFTEWYVDFSIIFSMPHQVFFSFILLYLIDPHSLNFAHHVRVTVEAFE